MKSRRALCGWVNFHNLETSPEALEAMLAAEELSPSGLEIQSVPEATLALSLDAGALHRDADSGCLIAILGRPRWVSPALASQARAEGHAAAAMTGYRAHGSGLLADVHGNFALIIVDPPGQRLILALDRTGTERLCFASHAGWLVFSTSARAVARHPAINAAINRQALFEYLYCHMVPSPDTAFAGVEKLLPAQYLEMRASDIRRSHYWQLAYSRPDDGSEASTAARFRELTRQAVARQSEEGSVGAFLSGGTDSSTVSGLLGQVTGRPAQTFSIGFDAAGFDELEYARITSRHFKTQAHEYYVTPQDVADAIPLIAQAYDEPFGNASAAPTYFCARLAKEAGMDAILAGDGGDEFFGGNERYAKQGVFEHYQRIPGGLRRLLEPVILGIPLSEAILPLRKAQSYIRQARIPLPDRLETYNFLHRNPLQDIFEPEFLAAIDTERPITLMRDAYFRCTSPDPVERMMHLDHKFTLADNDLRKVTRMCEMAGIEVRFPFLDDDLVEFSSTLSPSLKVSGSRLRVLFKDALRGFLPDETITKSKHGFGLPFGVWLANHGPLKSLVDGALRSLGQRGIVKPAYLDRLKHDHATSHASYFGVMIWVLIQLELWLQANS